MNKKILNIFSKFYVFMQLFVVLGYFFLEDEK